MRPPVRLADIIPQTGKIDIVTVTSQDGLQNLLEMAELEQCREWLLNIQVVAISPRIAELAAKLGFKQPALIAEQATDEAMVAACTTYVKT